MAKVMNDADIKKILAESTRLPTMPTVAADLLSITEWEDVDFNEVATLISKDVSLTSKVLRVVNSAFYGFPREISTISQALVVLGARATRSLTLSFSILAAVPRKRTSQFDYPAFWTRSLNTAIAAREFALIVGLRAEEEAFLSGLLQNVGVMALAHCVPQVYARAVAKAKDKLAPSVEDEKEHLGMDHVEVARLLFERWNVPPSLSTPVLYHHDPDKAKSADEQMLLAIRVQYLAGRLGEWLYALEGDNKSLEELKQIASRYFDVSPEELEALMCRIDQKVEETAGLFEITAPRPGTYANILQKANLALGDIAIEQEQLLRQLKTAKEETHKLSEQLRIANNRLLDEARKDELTDLANRRSLEGFLERELERCARYGHPIALLFIDIDNFKAVNDEYGHLEGDAALRQFAKILKHEVRGADIVARHGGEEFVAALVETTADAAMLVAERIRQSVEQTQIQLDAGRPPANLTASVGVAAWEPPEKSVTADRLLERADEAMYRSKAAGKNCVSLWRSGTGKGR
jgi:diguanylate cyclase (GGDEF)-like protein